MFEAAVAVAIMVNAEYLHAQHLTPQQRQERSDRLAAEYKARAQADHDKTVRLDRTRARQMFMAAARGERCPWRRFKR